MLDVVKITNNSKTGFKQALYNATIEIDDTMSLLNSYYLNLYTTKLNHIEQYIHNITVNETMIYECDDNSLEEYGDYYDDNKLTNEDIERIILHLGKQIYDKYNATFKEEITTVYLWSIVKNVTTNTKKYIDIYHTLVAASEDIHATFHAGLNAAVTDTLKLYIQ